MSRSTLSQRIIFFLANLAQFQHIEINSEEAAERILDGTIFLCPSNAEEQEVGLLVVRWNGDPNRETVVMGTQIAEFEIIAAVRHWVALGEMQDERASIEHLFQHFKVKTGASLQFAKEDRLMPKSIERLLKDLGWSAFKKLLGF